MPEAQQHVRANKAQAQDQKRVFVSQQHGRSTQVSSAASGDGTGMAKVTARVLQGRQTGQAKEFRNVE